MPAGINVEHRADQMALLIAQGTTATEAARQVGYKNPEANVAAIMARNGIRERVEQFRVQLRDEGKRVHLTPEFVMRNTAELAMQRENLPAAVQATRLAADCLGMLAGGKQDLSPEVSQLMEAIGRGAQQAAEAERRRQLTSVTVEQPAE